MNIRENVASVYIIKNMEIPRIKIGFSKNVQKRFDNIKNQSGCKMELLYFTKPIHDYYEVENDMHYHFRHSRGIGEWFDVDSKRAIEHLKNLTDNSKVCDVVRMFEDGWNATKISQEISVSRSGVVKYLKSLGYMVKVDKPKDHCIGYLSTSEIEDMILKSKNKLGIKR